MRMTRGGEQERKEEEKIGYLYGEFDVEMQGFGDVKSVRGAEMERVDENG